ncbi:MAG: hypothetical protein LH473_14115, partial [Chitinophagales bacterium]|nr:hypothetical protein [Chitinophagales bacterium]
EMINANRAMIIQDDGKILVGGQDAQLNAMIERLNIDGSIDTGFNSGQSRDGKKLHLSVGVLTDRKQINLKWLVRSRAIKESWWWRGNM